MPAFSNFSRLVQLARRGLLMSLALVVWQSTIDAASRVYVTNLDGTIAMYDSVTDRIINNILFGPGIFPEAIAITPNGAYAYVSDIGMNTVIVIATATNQVVRTVTVGDDPRGVAFTPDGAFAYVVNSGSDSVSVIATAINSVVATIRLATGSRPNAIAITPDGTRAYVANTGTSNVSVINTATNHELTGAGYPIRNSGPPEALAIVPDGSEALVISAVVGGAVLSIDLIELPTDQRLGNVTFFDVSQPAGIALSSDGNHAYLTAGKPDRSGVVVHLQLLHPTFSFMSEIPVGQVPTGIAVEQDGGTHGYVANTLSGTLSVIDTQTNASVGVPVPVGHFPQNVAILSHPDPIINFNITFNAAAPFGSLFNLVGLLSILSAPVDDPSLVSSVIWDFYGDASVVSTTSTLDTQFTYTQAGTFTPKVTVLFTDGTQASRTTTLRVQSPADAIGTAESLVDWLSLPDGLGHSLVTKLDAASQSAGRFNTRAACGQIQAFENELGSLVTDGQLDASGSAPVRGEAAAIRVSLGCQ